MSIWEYGILFLSVFLGGGLALYIRPGNKAILQLFLSFSGAFILGITVLHLMPSVFSAGNNNIGLWILFGFFVQLMLEQLSLGLEHGHIHIHKAGHFRFAFQIMIGLGVHAFIEGMPLSSYPELHQNHQGFNPGGNHLLFSIILHKAPAAFALGSMLVLSGYKRVFIIGCLLFFASMSPLGAATTTGFILSKSFLTNILALVIGSFLHIATTILFESDNTQQHKFSLKKLVVIVAGLLLSILTIL